MREWGKAYPGIEGTVEMFGDGDASVTKALGFEVDLGTTAWACAAAASPWCGKGVITPLHLEEGFKRRLRKTFSRGSLLR